LPGLVTPAKPEDLKDEALEQAALENGAPKPESKSDAARLALLNSMRQPPPGAHHAPSAGAFGLEGGAGLKEGKLKGEGGDGSRTSILAVPRGAETAQAPATVPNLAAPERSVLGALQRPDHSQPPLMERVGHEVRWMIRTNRNEATIRLEPDHLGRLRARTRFVETLGAAQPLTLVHQLRHSTRRTTVSLHVPLPSCRVQRRTPPERSRVPRFRFRHQC